jgi:hypothetical protein
VTVAKHSFRCKYKGNETFCSFKIVVCQKGTYLFTSVFNFPTVINLNYSPLSALNEANLTSATQILNFNPTMHYQAKTSQPDGKIANLRFASLIVEICR